MESSVWCDVSVWAAIACVAHSAGSACVGVDCSIACDCAGLLQLLRLAIGKSCVDRGSELWDAGGVLAVLLSSVHVAGSAKLDDFSSRLETGSDTAHQYCYEMVLHSYAAVALLAVSR